MLLLAHLLTPEMDHPTHTTKCNNSTTITVTPPFPIVTLSTVYSDRLGFPRNSAGHFSYYPSHKKPSNLHKGMHELRKSHEGLPSLLASFIMTAPILSLLVTRSVLWTPMVGTLMGKSQSNSFLSGSLSAIFAAPPFAQSPRITPSSWLCACLRSTAP